jgi:pimeloyl-ACP methyl ester carboxylesterase
MPIASVGGIDLSYETVGDPADPPLLLICGLGGQLVGWPDAFLQRIADTGRYVVVYDHRDIGGSSHLTRLARPNIAASVAWRAAGVIPSAPYSLFDMARDAIALLDFLEVDRVDVAGQSMGGMIAQVLAIEWPDRVRSLLSMSSTTGSWWAPWPHLRGLLPLLWPTPGTFDEQVEHMVWVMRKWAGPPNGIPFDEEGCRESARRSLERSTYSEGIWRHLAAVFASPDRTEALRGLDMPAVVLHGDQDPIIPLGCGVATATAIPGARMSIIEGLGHSLPPAVWDDFIEALQDVSGRADSWVPRPADPVSEPDGSAAGTA